MVDNIEWMLFEYLVTATGATPPLLGIALLAAVTLIALAVALLQVIGVLRFRSASSIRFAAGAPAARSGRSVRGAVRARAPSVDREPARA